MILLTVRDLAHRWLRFLLVTLLVAVVLSLLFVMTGIANRFKVEPYDSVKAIGAPYWIIPAGSSGPFTANGTVPVEAAAQAGTPHAEPIVVARATAIKPNGKKKEVVLIGVVAGSLGSPKVASGRELSGPGQAVVDAKSGLHVGDAATIGGAQVTVVGVVHDRTVFAGTPLAFLELGQVQDMVYGSRTVASAILVDAQPASVPAGLALRTRSQVADDALSPVKNAVSSITLMVVLLWLVAAIVIGAVVFLSALERQRDFAVLKAMGAKNRVLAGGLTIQAGLVALVAAVAASLLQRLLHPVFPLGVQVPGSAFLRIPLITIAVSLVAALAGIRRVLRVDPAQAFGGPGA